MSNCSVIMVSHQTGPILFASIKSVLKQKGLAELVVVDNGNAPDVLTRLQQLTLDEPRLKVVKGHGNMGYARGCNLGVKNTTGYYLALMHPDCLLPPDALSDLMAAYEHDSQAVITSGEVLDAEGHIHPESTRSLLSPFSAIKNLFTFRHKQLPSISKVPYEVPAVSGAFICIRRKDYDRLNGMDETYFTCGANMDICMRVHRFGGKTILVPAVKITRLSGNDESFKRVIEWHKAKGQIYYFCRHFGGRFPIGFTLVMRLIVMMVFAIKVGFDWVKRQLRPSYVMSHSIPSKRLMILASGLADLQLSDELAGKTVLVTGATSQVGLCVVRRMIASGAAVLAISRNNPIPFAHENLRWIKGDLTDSRLHLDGYLVDVVVHCAPLWHLPPTLELLKDAEVQRVIAFGSTSVFGKMLSKNRHEQALVEKLSRAESEIEERCDELKMDWTILRPTMIYGVGLDVGITTLAQLIKFLSFFPIYPPAFGRRQPVHADDLAIAALKVINNETTYRKSYNVSGGEVLTYREMLEDLFKVCGKKLRIEENTMLPFLLDVVGRLTGKRHINGEIARRMNDDLVFFHDDAKRDFAYAPRRFLSGGEKDIEGY
ncbi:MAG: glycosyltransferase [Rickettsiales bacterium]